MTPANPWLGMAKVLAINVWLLSMGAVSVAAFYVWDHPMLEWFGVSLAVGFVGVASIELVRFGVGPMIHVPRER